MEESEPEAEAPPLGLGVFTDEGHCSPHRLAPGLHEGGRFGGSVPGCISAPHLPGGDTEERGAASPCTVGSGGKQRLCY